jgi:hypothetical protein
MKEYRVKVDGNFYVDGDDTGIDAAMRQLIEVLRRDFFDEGSEDNQFVAETHIKIAEADSAEWLEPYAADWGFAPYPNFTPGEISCPCGCGKMNVDPMFMCQLQVARWFSGIPLRVTSGGVCRCDSYNLEVGGKEDSSHLPGHAGDFSCTTFAKRIEMIHSFYKVGIVRIGIGPTFLHVDNDPNKGPAMWLYLD